MVKASIPAKRISWNFDFGDLRSGQFRDLTIIRQWQNVHITFFCESTSVNVLFSARYFNIGPLLMTRMQFWPSDLFFGLLEVICGHTRFLPLTCDTMEIERWGSSQYVSLAQTHRLTCNMTYLAARHVNLCDLDLKQRIFFSIFNCVTKPGLGHLHDLKRAPWV